jgi:hypothetical protein
VDRGADRPRQPPRLAAWHRLICRRERPHPGAQLSFTDLDGHRFQCFITDQTGQDIAALEALHRQHAQVEDRVKTLKATGASSLPFHCFAANAAWFELALCGHDITVWTQMLTLDGEHRICEPQGCATESCTSPASSPATPDATPCTSPPTGPGPARSSARSNASRRSQLTPNHRQPTTPSRTVGTPPALIAARTPRSRGRDSLRPPATASTGPTPILPPPTTRHPHSDNTRTGY